MTKREQQYINWNKYHKRQKQSKVTFTELDIDGMACHKAVIIPDSVRVPDWLLKKMSQYN